MSGQVLQLLDGWDALPPVPRRPCECGRAYVVNPAPGQPCHECLSDVDRPSCPECGDRGWVWKPNAVRHADEWAGRTACPVCSPDSGPAYD